MSNWWFLFIYLFKYPFEGPEFAFRPPMEKSVSVSKQEFLLVRCLGALIFWVEE